MYAETNAMFFILVLKIIQWTASCPLIIKNTEFPGGLRFKFCYEMVLSLGKKANLFESNDFTY